MIEKNKAIIAVRMVVKTVLIILGRRGYGTLLSALGDASPVGTPVDGPPSEADGEVVTASGTIG